VLQGFADCAALCRRQTLQHPLCAVAANTHAVAANTHPVLPLSAAWPYLNDGVMPQLGGSVKAALAVVVGEHEQLVAAIGRQ